MLIKKLLFIIITLITINALGQTQSRMMPFISKVAELDNQLSQAITVYRQSREKGIKALKECGQACDMFNERFVNNVADILNLEKNINFILNG
jgi:hypothetical protein